MHFDFQYDIMEQLLLSAIHAALEAGNAIDLIYNDPKSDFGIERKSDNSPLTIADKKSHNVIISYLKDTPYPILSEEGRMIPYEERKQWNTLWIIDPLDGTKEFIKKNGEFTVNIALVENGTPVLGVIYLPVKRTLYFAAKGIGSFKTEVNSICNQSLNEWIEASQKLPIPDDSRPFRIVASRSHCSEETMAFISQVELQYGKAELVSSGSSIKICMIAEGSADIYPRFAGLCHFTHGHTAGTA